MITEDYVSFEIAKLLKKKGFYSEDCFAFYKKTGEIGFLQTFGDIVNYNSEPCIIAPTCQMAMKWLREVHKECIIVYPIVTDDDGSAGCLWQCSILKLLKTQYKSAYAYEFYEQACEEAIRYCLINLI